VTNVNAEQHATRRNAKRAQRASGISTLARLFLAAITLGATSCGGGGGSDTATFSIGGSVSGLAGSGLVLQNNGTDSLSVSSTGGFTFATQLQNGQNYAVTVKTQPANPTQVCTATNGSGAVANRDVQTVAVACVTMFSIGATVNGLTGSGLVLQDNGVDDLAVAASGSITFSTAVASGAPYDVTIKTQPSNPVQNCTLKNGTARGTVNGADITTIEVVCANIGRFVYAANLGDLSISAFAIDATTGALKPVTGSPFVGPLRTSFVATETSGRLLYTLDPGNGINGVAATGIDVYTIDSTTGAITAVAGSPFPIDAPPFSIVIDANGKFAYTANVNAMSVSGYAINPTTGAVGAPVAGSPFAVGGNPESITTDSGGRFVYAANNSGSYVSAFAVDGVTGALTPTAGSPFKAGSAPFAVAVDPTGKFAYVANDVSNDVSGFSIDPNSGALKALAGSPYAAGLNPAGVSIDPSGTFLFVANANAFGTPGANNVSVFRIDASTGALTPVPGSPFATDTLSLSVAVDPSGKFVYVANGDPPANNISAFAINPNTGSLTPVPGSPFSTGPNPQSIAVSK